MPHVDSHPRFHRAVRPILRATDFKDVSTLILMLTLQRRNFA